jgi:hypothetical protein
MGQQGDTQTRRQFVIVFQMIVSDVGILMHLSVSCLRRGLRFVPRHGATEALHKATDYGPPCICGSHY